VRKVPNDSQANMDDILKKAKNELARAINNTNKIIIEAYYVLLYPLFLVMIIAFLAGYEGILMKFPIPPTISRMYTLIGFSYSEI